ncbi:MAG: hypothetical protein MI743_20415 [Sneathiellales bacterium]|nr:hypothetical protein [Sneathiellales bacterium]
MKHRLLYGIATACVMVAGTAYAWGPETYGVELLDIRGVEPAPVMKVSTSDGQAYDTAADHDLFFNVESKAQCRKLNYLKLAEVVIYPKNVQYRNEALGEKVYISKAKLNQRTLSTSWLAASIRVKPDSYLKEHAIKACNKELNKRISQGQNKFYILKTGFNVSMTKTTHHQFNLKCGGLSGDLTGASWTKKNDHPVTVRCGSFQPKQVSLDPSALPSFKLISAAVSMQQTNYKGKCPAALPVKAKITSSDFGGEFQYRFLEDGKAVTPWKNKSVGKGKTVTQLSHTVVIKKPSANPGQGTPGFQAGIQNQGNAQVLPQLQEVPKRKVSIQVKRGNQQISNFKEFQATCKEIKKATFVGGKAKEMTLALPDLMSRTGITIGTQSSSWGGSLNLKKEDAMAVTPRGCKFRFKYDVRNIGDANATANHRLRGKANAPLHTATNFKVDKKDTRNVSGHIFLKAGSYKVKASLDDTKKVTEKNENNNKYSVNVNVDEDCGGQSSSPRPTGSSPRPRPQQPAGPQ